MKVPCFILGEMMKNLNEYPINYESTTIPPDDHSIKTEEISVYFRNIEDRLIDHIYEADAVFGAVAWLTNDRILDALCCTRASIIVQKEDFLRPDSDFNHKDQWKEKLREKYSIINNYFTRYDIPNVLSEMSLHSNDMYIGGVRCVGNHNRDKKPAFPRMHNKFLVFAKTSEREPIEHEMYPSSEIKPYAVWTGSFNFTKNATNSLENALYITTPSIVEMFFKEYGQIAAISEELDWDSDWIEPEWRIGT